MGHHWKIRSKRTKQSLKHGGKGERDLIFIFIYLAASDLSCGTYQQLNLALKGGFLTTGPPGKSWGEGSLREDEKSRRLILERSQEVVS